MRRALAAVFLVVLAVAGAAMWFGRERRPELVLTTNFAKNGAVAVQVNRFELAWERPGSLSKMPPAWMADFPWLLRGWVRLHREIEHVYDGLVWVVVEATVTSDQPLDLKDIAYQLDYNDYTIGAHGGSFSSQRPHPISTRFEVTEGPIPKALEIQVKGEWFRFPIEVR